MLRNFARLALCIGVLSLLAYVTQAQAATLQPIADASGVITTSNGTEYFNGWVVSYNGYTYARCSYQNSVTGDTMLAGGCHYKVTANSVTFYGQTYYQNGWCSFTYLFQKNSDGSIDVTLKVVNSSGSVLLNRSGVLNPGASFWVAG